MDDAKGEANHRVRAEPSPGVEKVERVTIPPGKN